MINTVRNTVRNTIRQTVRLGALLNYVTDYLDAEKTAAEIDAILINLASKNISGETIDIRGNEKRTSASDSAVTTLTVTQDNILLEDVYSVSISASSIAENNSIGDVVGILSATNPTLYSYTFSLVAGTGDTDNASFTIDGANLKAAEAFDFETKSSYSIRVQADNGDFTFETAIELTVLDMSGAELITNGGFDTDTDWTKGAGWSIDGGVAIKSAGSTNTILQYSAIFSGKEVKVTYDIVEISGGSIRSGSHVVQGTSRSAVGTYTDTFTPFSGTIGFFPTSTFSGAIDNVSVKEVL